MCVMTGRAYGLRCPRLTLTVVVALPDHCLACGQNAVNALSFAIMRTAAGHRAFRDHAVANLVVADIDCPNNATTGTNSCLL